MEREHIEYRDKERCDRCGGVCCRVYIPCYDGSARPIGTSLEEWCDDWNNVLDEAGAFDIVEPNFDPLVVHLKGNEHMLHDLEEKGIDPYSCPYKGEKGCMLPRSEMPRVCKEYRCLKWVRDTIRSLTGL